MTDLASVQQEPTALAAWSAALRQSNLCTICRHVRTWQGAHVGGTRTQSLQDLQARPELANLQARPEVARGPSWSSGPRSSSACRSSCPAGPTRTPPAPRSPVDSIAFRTACVMRSGGRSRPSGPHRQAWFSTDCTAYRPAPKSYSADLFLKQQNFTIELQDKSGMSAGVSFANVCQEAGKCIKEGLCYGSFCSIPVSTQSLLRAGGWAAVPSRGDA